MKDITKLIILIIGLIIGMGLMIWGNIIMRNYDGYLEIMKAARREAAPQFIMGLVFLFVTYGFTYKFKK